ncbi:hypothetical protein Zmor_006308 [Zophobas morio]|uniref:Uncharacterized protein n=1 Tax=Zophobas morio TaxID=2755281 RepID=A0AA38IRE3_9CUCU|nr:hypothetical protein Zmor_006308 [Zophobas morio]
MGLLQAVHYNKHINMDTTDPQRTANLWIEAIYNFTPEMWQNSITHCEKLLEEDWKKAMGNFSVQDIPPITVKLTEDDSDSDFSISEMRTTIKTLKTWNLKMFPALPLFVKPHLFHLLYMLLLVCFC